VRSALVIFGAGLVLVACTSDIYFGGNPINMRSTTIGVGDYFFDPTLDTVPAGATVTWAWVAGNQSVHNVTWDTGPALPPNSNDMMAGSYQVSSLGPGTYTYHCTYHGTPATGNVMVGTLVVESP